MPTVWTPELDDRLRELFAAKHAATEIANTLGLGLTRAAVCGRLHRLGIKRYPDDKPRLRIVSANGNSPALRVIEPPKSIELPPLRCAEVEPRNLSVLDLEANDCRWVMTDDSPFLFCGLPKAFGSSYCADHFKLSVGVGTASEQAATRLSTRQRESA